MRAADSTYASILGSILSTADARSLGPRNFSEPGLSISNFSGSANRPACSRYTPAVEIGNGGTKRRISTGALSSTGVTTSPRPVTFASPPVRKNGTSLPRAAATSARSLRVAARSSRGSRAAGARWPRPRCRPRARPPSGRVFRAGSALAARFRPRGPGASPRGRRCCRRPPALPERRTRARAPRASSTVRRICEADRRHSRADLVKAVRADAADAELAVDLGGSPGRKSSWSRALARAPSRPRARARREKA